MIPNFNLSSGGAISDHLISKKILTFYDALRYISNLPYSRSKLKYPKNIIKDEKGTCSTKHAFIKELADENNIRSIDLCMCIYPMMESNTPGVGGILDRFKLDYILEAHVYITYDDIRYDFTFPDKKELSWESDILMETSIDVDQIGDYKVNYHKNVLKEWIERDGLDFSLSDIWQIRESCIRALQTFD